MTEEWKICMMQCFLRKMQEDGYNHHLAGIEALCYDICGPDFIKEHISLVEDAETAKRLLRLDAIRNLPVETILSDMLTAGLLKDIREEDASRLIKSAQCIAPQALFGFIIEHLAGKFKTDDYTGVVSDAVYIQQHILQWAKDCGPILNGLFVHVEEDKENDSFGLVKAVLGDRGYILEKLPGAEVEHLDLAMALVNTLLEDANVTERLIALPTYFRPSTVLANEKTLQELSAKYDLH